MSDIEFLRNAYCVARMSRDPSSQNGAVLVSPEGEIIGSAANNFAIGVPYNVQRATARPEKYLYVEHSERGAIYAAARAGNKVYGATMYCMWSACCDCARGIINSGVRRLVMHKERMDMTPERWIADVNVALLMMVEAGVTLSYYKGPIDDAPEIRVNGELWQPDQPSLVENGNWFVGMKENDLDNQKVS